MALGAATAAAPLEVLSPWGEAWRVFRSNKAALLGLLMLRGPQTAGELRVNSERWHRFADISSVFGVPSGCAVGATGLQARPATSRKRRRDIRVGRPMNGERRRD